MTQVSLFNKKQSAAVLDGLTATDTKVDTSNPGKVLVVWTTTIPASSQVSYSSDNGKTTKLSPLYDMPSGKEGGVLYHKVEISGLSGGGKYIFTPISCESKNSCVSSARMIADVPVEPVDTEAPLPPSNLSASSIGMNSFVLNWDPTTDNLIPQNQIRYDIYGPTSACGTAGLCGSTVGVNALSISGLTPGRTYSGTSGTNAGFSVQAYDVAGNYSSASPRLSVTMLNDTQAPTAPTNLTSPAKTLNSVSLSWSLSTDNVGVSGYNVYVDGSSTPTNTSLISGTLYTVTGLTAGDTYTFKVKAKDAAGNLSASSNTISVTTIANPALTISGMVVSGSGTSSRIITWTTNAPADTQVVYDTVSHATAGGYTYATPINSALVTSHSVTLTGLVVGQTYYIKAKSTDANGTMAVSNEVNFANVASCPNTATDPYERAMWVWKNNSAVITAGDPEQTALFAFTDAKKIQRIYLYVNKSNLQSSTFTTKLKTFLNTAWDQHCLSVELLDGSPKWVAYPGNGFITPATITDASDYISAVIAFKNSITAGNTSPVGVHLDVEPHGFTLADYPGYSAYWSGSGDALPNPLPADLCANIAGNQTALPANNIYIASSQSCVLKDPATISKAYLGLLQNIKTQLAGAGLTFAVDVARWYDTSSSLSSITWNGVTKNLMKHVFGLVDELGIMDYNTTPSTVYNDAEDELNEGLAIGKKVTIGLETIDLTSFGGGNGTVSFWTTNCAALDTALSSVYTSISAAFQTSAFSRFAIHAFSDDKNGVLSGYRHLCP